MFHRKYVYVGVLGCADDLAIIAPSLQSLKHMTHKCEQFAIEYDIKFNPKKSKLACHNVKCTDAITITLFDEKIEIVNVFLHLGNFVSDKLWKKNKKSSRNSTVVPAVF